MRLPKFKFIGQISKAADNRIIWIPKKFHKEIESKSLVGKQVRIVIDDEY
jgi:hypothetical protein